MGLERHPAIELAPRPTTGGLAPPVPRMGRAHAVPPREPGFAPQLVARVAAIFDEREILRLRHRRARHAERLHLTRVRVLLVVEDEVFLAARGAELDRSAGDLG